MVSSKSSLPLDSGFLPDSATSTSVKEVHVGARSLEGCGPGEWLSRLEPGAAGQLAGGEYESMTFARERRTPAS
eukprot:4106781-Prymnesium_polylepis.1